MRVREAAPGIFVIRFRSQYELASTFLRFQEHYESARFKNRVFTLEEFMDWYARQFGAFTYFQDWAGFNLPSTAFTPFIEGRFDPLLRKEQRLLTLLKRRRRPFYVVGITSTKDLTHELAHALYFMSPAYRQAVKRAMRRYKLSPLKRRLARMGYHASVLADEAHAYLVDGRGFGIEGKPYARASAELRALYRKHWGAFTR